MLSLKANEDQKRIFNDLIEEMGVQVVWDGHFVIMGDRLILEGIVRSLFFHLDIQKIEVGLVDLSTDDEDVLEISDYPGLQDFMMMAVYAFEKWGVLQGVYVGQDIPEVCRSFAGILSTYQLGVIFDEDGIQFLKDGIRITFEEAVEIAAGYEKQTPSMPRLVLPIIGGEDPCNGGQEAEGMKDNPCNGGQEAEGMKDKTDAPAGQGSDIPARDSATVADRIDKFHKRIGVIDRFSDRQKKELLRDIKNDKLLSMEEKAELLYPIQDYEYQERMHALDVELKDSKNRTYAAIQKIIKKVEKEDLLQKTKTDILEKLRSLEQQYGTEEVRQIMENVPKHVERAEYQELMRSLYPYEGIDMSPYREMLRKMRETLEIKEISNLLMQSPKKSRADYVELIRNIWERDFAEENSAPYIDRCLDTISEFDKMKLNGLLKNVQAMDYNTAASVYLQIRRESFLPTLREKAMSIVAERLKRSRMEEVVQLAHKLQQGMTGRIQEDPRHHFSPIGRNLPKAVEMEEVKIIDTALSVYAEERGMFEYPIITIDTSKNGSGRDGMLLTSDHLFYSTRLSGYKVPVASIKSIYVSSGLINRRVILDDVNGVAHKLPYVVSAEELQDWAEILDRFVQYLKTRQASMKPVYIERLAEETVCCSRCGCVHDGQDKCPECGYTRMR